MALPVEVRELLEGEDPQPRASHGRDDLPESPRKQVATLGVLEVLHPIGETRWRQAAPRLADVVAYAFWEEPRFSTRRIGTTEVPVLVEHLCHRVEVHEHEAPTGSQDRGDAPGPGVEVGEPANHPV